MGDLAPVAVAIPLLTAAMLVAVTAIVPRRVIDMLAIASFDRVPGALRARARRRV